MGRHGVRAGCARRPAGFAQGDGRREPQDLQISGVGWSSQIGQTYGLDADWPHFEVADYTRVIDYDARWSREDYTRRQGSYPTFGRVPMAEQHVTAILSGNYAWDMQGTNAVPFTRMYLDGVPYNILRQLELALNVRFSHGCA